MRVAVVGATGRIGRFTVAALRDSGHEVVEISRAKGIDVIEGDGLGAALAGTQAVVDVTSNPAQDTAEVVDFFTTAARNVLAAATGAGVRHYVLLSIVNVDSGHGGSHYAGKLAQERVVETGGIPWSIVRATQFHDFGELVASWTLDNGTARVAPMLCRPIAPKDVGDVLAEIATGAPVGRMDIAGPENQDLVDMARRTLAARGEQIRLEPTWDGPIGVSMAGNVALPKPGARIAPTTFDAWLTEQSTPGAA
jgi:uncharacterized protein YbjT (DUF2867 family)